MTYLHSIESEPERYVRRFWSQVCEVIMIGDGVTTPYRAKGVNTGGEGVVKEKGGKNRERRTMSVPYSRRCQLSIPKPGPG